MEKDPTDFLTEELTLDGVEQPQAEYETPKSKLNVVALDESKMNLKMKGDEKYLHHKAKLEVAYYKVNTNYQGGVDLTSQVHNHIFHSVDRRGNKNEYCVPIGGHRHAVQLVGQDSDGHPVYKCGPALKEVAVKTRNGRYIKKLEQISFGMSEDGRELLDDHTHDVTYLSSEEIWPNKQAEQAALDAKKLASLMSSYKKAA